MPHPLILLYTIFDRRVTLFGRSLPYRPLEEVPPPPGGFSCPLTRVYFLPYIKKYKKCVWQQRIMFWVSNSVRFPVPDLTVCTLRFEFFHHTEQLIRLHFRLKRLKLDPKFKVSRS